MKESWSTFAKVLVTVGLSVRHDLKFCKEKKKRKQSNWRIKFKESKPTETKTEANVCINLNNMKLCCF